jgi:sulfate adenylyltransferase subunit 1 (EFTu-like GTPase family)
MFHSIPQEHSICLVKKSLAVASSQALVVFTADDSLQITRADMMVARATAVGTDEGGHAQVGWDLNDESWHFDRN